MKKIVVLFLIATFILVYFYKSEIKNVAVDYVRKNIEDKCGCQVEIANLHYKFPFSFYIDEISLYKKNEFKIYSKDVYLSLLSSDLHFKDLKMGTLIIEKEQQSSQSYPLYNLSTLPSLTISSFKIKELIYNKEIFPYPIEGYIDINALKKNLALNLWINDTTTFSLKIEDESVVAKYNEEKISILSQYLPLPKGYKYSVNYENGNIFVEYLLDNLSLKNLFLEESGSFSSFLSWNEIISLSSIEGFFGKTTFKGNLVLDKNGYFLNTFFNAHFPLFNFKEMSTHSLDTQMALKGTWDDPNFFITYKADDLRFKDIALGPFQGDVLGTSENFKFNLSASDTKINGCYDPNNVFLNGSLDASLLKPYLPSFSGTPFFDLHITNAANALCHLKVPEFQFLNFVGKNLEVKANIHDVFENLSWDLSGAFESEIFSAITFNAKSDSNFNLSLKNRDDLINLEGLWNNSLIQVNLLKGHLQNHAITLLNPFTFSLSEPLTFSPIDLKWGNGSIYANKTHLKVEKFPLESLQFIFKDCPLNGLLFAEGHISPSETGLLGNLKVKVNEIALFKNTLSTPLPMDAFFDAIFEKDWLTCSGNITGLSPTPSQFILSLPLQISLKPFAFNLDETKPFAFNFNLESKIESLLEILAPQATTHLTGDAFINLMGIGSLSFPQIEGKIELHKGTYELFNIGGSVKNVECIATLKNKTLTLTHLTASQQRGGTLWGKGEIEFDFSKDLPFFLELEAKNLYLNPASYIDIMTEGKVKLSGTTKKGLLEGKITSQEIVVLIPEQIPEVTKSVEVTYINQPHDKLPPTQIIPRKIAWPLSYNLSMEIPNNCVVKDKNLKSLWKGHAQLNTLNEALNLQGGCQCTQGQYRFNGKTFEIKEGNITFSGDPEKKTHLYIIASKDLEEIQADIILKGPLHQPAISFRSNPPLPQREILSWILFNRGSSEINQFQGFQLNDSITNLSANQDDNVFTKIRDRIGIDRIDINRGENGTSNEVSLQVGKYISQGIFVSVNKSITAETNRVAVEADLVKNVKVQAEVGDDAAGQLQLKWKKDY